MAEKITRSLLSAKFGSTDMLKPRSHDFSLLGTDLVHGAGADLFASLIEKHAKFPQVIVGFDDANSVAAIFALADTTGDLVVKDLDSGSVVAGRQFTWKDARLMDVTGAERFAIVGEFAAVFQVPAFDGATNPLTVAAF